MLEALGLAMRWLHLSSLVVLIGGLVYLRFVATPSLNAVAGEAAEKLQRAFAAKHRPLVILSICGLLISGLFNLLTTAGHSLRYNVLLGIKLLLAFHIFGVAMVIVKPESPKRARLALGAVVSAVLIVLISAYLRHTF